MKINIHAVACDKQLLKKQIILKYEIWSRTLVILYKWLLFTLLILYKWLSN